MGTILASIEPGNQLCKPSTADLAPAPINNKIQIIVIRVGFIEGANENTTSKSREPKTAIIIKNDTERIQSPNLF
jgi:hypothetical protein